MLEIVRYDVKINSDTDIEWYNQRLFTMCIIDGNIEFPSIWVSIVDLECDMSILYQCATGNIEVVDEDSHTFYKYILTSTGVLVYTGEVVYPDEEII